MCVGMTVNAMGRDGSSPRTWGTLARDAVLRHLAAGLSATFRATDIVARFGGEEFVVLLPGSPSDEAQAIAQRLCPHVAAKPVNVDGASIHCTVSAGVAGVVSDVDGLDALMKRADTALYWAKARGRNRMEPWHAELASFATSPKGRKPAWDRRPRRGVDQMSRSSCLNSSTSSKLRYTEAKRT